MAQEKNVILPALMSKPLHEKDETDDEESDNSDDDINISTDDEDDDNDDIDGEEGFVPKDSAFSVHPLDLTYSILLCADDFLRQELLDKMSRCQYSVPFVLPPTQRIQEDSKPLILHWGLRTMRRSYHYHNIVENKSLVDVECPLVSFVSFGEETSWKSRLLNKMLSPQQETFGKKQKSSRKSQKNQENTKENEV